MAPGTDGNIISYDASGNPVAVATGSAGQVLTSAGAGAPPTFAAAGVDGISSSADATAMTIDSNEYIGIGVTDPGSYSAKELVVGKTGSEAGMTIRSGSSNTANLYFADGTSGAERYQGFVQYDHPNGKMNLGTAGATQWSLDGSGNFLPAATDHGIYLGVTTGAASNLLHDYEEGTWTPAMTTSAGSLSSVTYGAYNKGWYTKVGRNVTINFNVHLNSKGSGGSGAVRLTGYPFGNTLLTASVYGSLYMYNGGVDQPCCTYGTWSTSHVTIRYVNDGAGGEVNYSDISNGSSWSGMMTYITNV
jgi:hypothetical protein|tara:strand:- start:200 stop:1111 length:912 start_codon:yes stop_codon:yes gene_type:complete